MTDKKLQVPDNTNTNVAYYNADIASASDYYPFGMQMPNRTYNAANYRYGFNGKELDKDMDGNNYDYGFRIYNPQIAKFLSVDPLTKKYPELTPYQFSSNSPIENVDLDGRESTPSISYEMFKAAGITKANGDEIAQKVNNGIKTAGHVGG